MDDTRADLKRCGLGPADEAFDLPIIGDRLGFFPSRGNLIELAEVLG